MSGTGLDEQLDIVKKFENLQYTDADIFCRHAFINRSIAYDGASSYSQEVHLRELAKILENNIKEDTYDEQAIEIARELFDNIEKYFLLRLIGARNKFKQSVQKQISKYRWTARVLKSIQQFLQLVVIIGAASVPLILSNPTSPREVSTYISIIVAVSAAILNFYKFQDHITFQQTAAERMQLEYNQFATQRGIYKNLDRGAALDLFMDEIDKLRQETNELSLSLEKAAQDQKLDQIQKMSKPTLEIHHTKDAQ